MEEARCAELHVRQPSRNERHDGAAHQPNGQRVRRRGERRLLEAPDDHAAVQPTDPDRQRARCPEESVDEPRRVDAEHQRVLLSGSPCLERARRAQRRAADRQAHLAVAQVHALVRTGPEALRLVDRARLDRIAQSDLRRPRLVEQPEGVVLRPEGDGLEAHAQGPGQQVDAGADVSGEAPPRPYRPVVPAEREGAVVDGPDGRTERVHCRSARRVERGAPAPRMTRSSGQHPPQLGRRVGANADRVERHRRIELACAQVLLERAAGAGLQHRRRRHDALGPRAGGGAGHAEQGQGR
jgi:hypothetical protein